MIARREQGVPSLALIAACIIEEPRSVADTFGEIPRLQAGASAASLAPPPWSFVIGQSH